MGGCFARKYFGLKAIAVRVYKLILLMLGKPHDPYKLAYTLRKYYESKSNIKKLIKIKGKHLSDDILSHKKTDTIFVLGSGPSINDLTDKQWMHIEQNDSIGFNWWLVHDFVPTYFILQVDSKTYNLTKALNDKIYLYRSVPFIIRGSGPWFEGDADYLKILDLLRDDQVHLLKLYEIHSKSELSPNSILKFLSLIGHFKKVRPDATKIYASITLAINLCFCFGYKNIVLCGIDMKDPSHFWDHDSFSDIRERYGLVKKEESDIMMHKGAKDRKYNVPHAIYAQDKLFRELNGTRLFVANDNTVLYPRINTYFSNKIY